MILSPDIYHLIYTGHYVYTYDITTCTCYISYDISYAIAIAIICYYQVYAILPGYTKFYTRFKFIPGYYQVTKFY